MKTLIKRLTGITLASVLWIGLSMSNAHASYVVVGDLGHPIPPQKSRCDYKLTFSGVQATALNANHFASYNQGSGAVQTISFPITPSDIYGVDAMTQFTSNFYQSWQNLLTQGAQPNQIRLDLILGATPTPYLAFTYDVLTATGAGTASFALPQSQQVLSSFTLLIDC